MNEIIVKGSQTFLGKEIPVVYGGFGEKQKCICDKTIAQMHSMELKNIRTRITDNIKRFKENIDFIDLKQRAYETSTLTNSINFLLTQLGYSKQSISQAEHIYILSERGYAKLIKIMDSDLTWEIHDALMEEYFQLREEKDRMLEELLLSPEFGIKALTKLKEEREQRQALENEKKLLEQKIKEDEPKVIFADSISVSNDLILIRELAKLICQNGVDIGEKRLYEWLRNNEYLISRKGNDYNMPTQKSMDLGLFKIKETVIIHSDGYTSINKTTKVTGKGQKYFINKFLNKVKKQIVP